MSGSSANPPQVGSPRSLRTYQTAIVAATVVLAVLHVPGLGSTDLNAAIPLFVLVVIARFIPIALAREKPITFVAALVFASAMLTSGAVAAASAMVGAALQARTRKPGDRLRVMFIGAQYGLAAFAAEAVHADLTGGPVGSHRAGWTGLAGMCLAAAVFVTVNALLVALASMRGYRERRRQVESVVRAEALSYAISFPFAVLMVAAYRAAGASALPVLAALLLVCAHAVRVTLENRMLRRQIRAVEALGHSCTDGVRTERPLQRFLDLARDLVAFDQAVLWLSDDARGLMLARAAYPEAGGLPDPSEAPPDALLARVAQRAVPLLIADASRYPTRDGRPATWLLYPIVLHGRCLGVAHFVRSAARPFTRAEELRLAALVPQVAVAYESVRLRHMMFRYADMATTDGLTGLLNYRRSLEVLREEVQRAQRYRRPLSMLMIDVDSFKQFNDEYGHPQGDLLLRAVARILRTSVRNVDYVGRYGGEEFIIVAPETGPDDAQILAERIRAAVEGARFDAGDGVQVGKTVSIGVAAFPEHGMNAADLVQHADGALYRAKRSGRNLVLMA